MATPVSALLQRSAPTADLKSVTCTLKHVIFVTTFFVLPAVIVRLRSGFGPDTYLLENRRVRRSGQQH